VAKAVNTLAAASEAEAEPLHKRRTIDEKAKALDLWRPRLASAKRAAAFTP
jgi:hypothetical protein